MNNNDEKSNNNDEKSNNNDVNTKKKTNKNIQNKIINVDDNISLSHTTDIYSIKLKNLWNLDEINIIYLLLLEIEKKFNSDKFNNSSSLIMCIEEILYGKDEILNNIVNKISTSL